MYEQRPSDSPHIQLVWRAHPDSDGVYLHSASEYWSFFFQIEHGKMSVYLSGPASTTRSLNYVADGQYWGIVCKSYIFMPCVAKKDILDMNIELPMTDAKTFIFNGVGAAVPTYETAEVFVDLLVQQKQIIADQLVAKALAGKTWMSERSIQRSVLLTTGLTQRRMLRIQQARKACALLQKGKTIASAAADAGYTDQSHMTKVLKLLAGQTPAQILSGYENK